MNLLYIILIVIILIIILWIGYTFLYSNTENFSNTENRKIYNIFKDIRQNNETFYEFKQNLNKNNIKFSKSKNDLTFNQYVELLKKYNKNNLNLDTIDQIRNNNL